MKVTMLNLAISILPLSTLAQVNCSQYPSASQVYKRLQQKPVQISLSELSRSCNITDTVKERLLYLLNADWSNCEIDSYIQHDIIANYEVYQIAERARKRAGNDEPKFNEAKNLLIEEIKAKQMQYLKEKKFFGVHESVIKAVALLGFNEAIPILKEALKDKSGRYNKSVVELCLAKLNDRFYLNKVLRDCQYNKSLDGDTWCDDFQSKLGKLMFLGTQESIYQLYQWLDITKKKEISSSGATGKAAGYALIFMQDAIVNEDFHQLIAGVDLVYEVTDDLILKTRQWWVANKGKYKINKKKYPDLR